MPSRHPECPGGCAVSSPLTRAGCALARRAAPLFTKRAQARRDAHSVSPAVCHPQCPSQMHLSKRKEGGSNQQAGSPGKASLQQAPRPPLKCSAEGGPGRRPLPARAVACGAGPAPALLP
jgi:hypothetical protein